MSLRSAVNAVKDSRARAGERLDRMLPFRRARHWFRGWRRSRPFWAGVYLLISGGIILSLPLAPLPIMLTVGMAAISGAAIGFIIIVSGLFVWFAPQQRTFIAVVAAVCCAISFVTSNLGGFGIGMIFGLLGASMAFGWQPPGNSAEGRRQAARRRAIVARRTARKDPAIGAGPAIENPAIESLPTTTLALTTSKASPELTPASGISDSEAGDPEATDPDIVEEEDPSLEAADQGLRASNAPRAERKHRVMPLAMLLIAATLTATMLIPLGVASAQASTSSAAWPTWWPTWPTWPAKSSSPTPSTPSPGTQPSPAPDNVAKPTTAPTATPGTPGKEVPAATPGAVPTEQNAPATPTATATETAPATNDPRDTTPAAPPVIAADPAQETVGVNISKVTVKTLSADLFTVKGSKYVNTVNGPLKVLVLAANKLTAKAYSLTSTDPGPRVTWNSDIVGSNMEIYVTKLDAWVGVLGLPVIPISLTPDSIPDWLKVPIPLFVANDISIDQVLIKVDINNAPSVSINVLPAA